MPRNFIQRSFTHWLAENRQHFCRRPMVVKYRKGNIDFLLEGAPLGIRVSITRMGASVVYEEDGVVLDTLADFDIVEQHERDGIYRCKLCVMFSDADAKTYASRNLLWRGEVFEPLLEWVNQKFCRDVWVDVWRSDGGSTACTVKNTFELNIPVTPLSNFVKKVMEPYK